MKRNYIKFQIQLIQAVAMIYASMGFIQSDVAPKSLLEDFTYTNAIMHTDSYYYNLCKDKIFSIQ